MEVKGKAVATVPSPASSTGGERSDSVHGFSDSESAAAEIESDVSNSHNDVADSEDDVADGEIDLDDSDDDDSEGDEGKENEAENVKDVVEGESEDQDPMGSLRKPKARASASKASRGGASSSKGPIARASSSKALRARASPWKAPLARASPSKALKPRASSSKALKARASSSIAPASGPWSDSDSGRSSNEVRSVSSPDSDGFTVRQVVPKRKKQVVAGTSRRRTEKKPARSESSETEAEKTRKRKRNRKEVDGAEEAQGQEKKKKEEEEEVVRGEGSAKSGRRAMFQRLWSEEDEIALLKGLGEYERLKGIDPFSEMDMFSEFIKGSVNIDFTLTQLKNKARRMRRKFMKNTERCKDGKAPSFKRSHDRRTFELSKTIWGDGRLNGPAKRGRPFGSKNCVASPKRKAARNPDAEENTRNFWTRYPWLLESIQIFPSMSETRKNFMKQKLMETSEEILEGLEGRWKGLWLSVCDACLTRYQLIKDQLELVQDGI